MGGKLTLAQALGADRAGAAQERTHRLLRALESTEASGMRVGAAAAREL